MSFWRARISSSLARTNNISACSMTVEPDGTINWP